MDRAVQPDLALIFTAQALGSHRARGQRMTTDDSRSDAELGAEVLAGWERIVRSVPDGPRRIRRLAAHLRVPVPDLIYVRDVRNRFAHADGSISRDDLLQAVRIIRRIQRTAGSSLPDDTTADEVEAQPPPLEHGTDGETDDARATADSVTDDADTEASDAGDSAAGSDETVTAGPPRDIPRPRRDPDPSPRKPLVAATDPVIAETSIEDILGRLRRAAQRLASTSSRVRDFVEDHWVAISVTAVVAVLLAVYATFGFMGLLAAPFVIVGVVAVVAVALTLAVMALMMVCIILAVCALIYAIALFVQGDYLQGLLFLGIATTLGVIFGVAREIWD